MATTQEFHPQEAERSYNQWHHLIATGAYSESPPEDYEDEWEPDGSLWHDDINIGEELAGLEARADAHDLKFVLQADKPFKLVALTEEEKQERDRRCDALRRAALVAVFQWQDQRKIVLNQGGYVMGKLPGDDPAYVVQIWAEIRERDPMMTYSWDAQETLVVAWRGGSSEPVIEDASEEQIKQVSQEAEGK